jgi:hypothetical protein
MGRACGTYGGEQKFVHGFGGGNPKEIDNSDPGLGWEYNIKRFRGMGWDTMVWIHVIQDRDEWRALLNKIITLQVP